MDYKASGVDIDAGNETVRRIKSLARSTFTPGVLSSIGSFGGLFRLGEGREDPVLVSSADGVGTKLKVAFMTGRHGTVGQDLVNHCVNDILVQGAEPLFFLDYLATGRLSPDVAAEVIEGMAAACRENLCALIGGETAEMPGFYADGEYDLAGFIVGVVERERLITGEKLAPGDALIGLRSTGLHTNGYSLARAILFEKLSLSADGIVGELGCTVADELLRVHRSYLPVVRPLLAARVVRGPRPHHRRRHHREPPADPSPGDRGAHRQVRLDAECGLPLSAACRRRGRGRDVPLVQHGHRPHRRVRGGPRLARSRDAAGRGRDQGRRDRPHRAGRARRGLPEAVKARLFSLARNSHVVLVARQ